MISVSPTTNQTSFTGIKDNINTVKKFAMPAIAALCIGVATPLRADTFEKKDSIEVIKDNQIFNPTKLNMVELAFAPSPVVKIANKDTLVGIVVDTETNKLYRYDADGNVVDGYHVATGRIAKNGSCITTKGIRRVHHIENYPYKTAYGTRRKENPKAYGPNILYLTIINPKTAAEEGSTGEFIHGNNKPSSIGTHDSGGCVRMDNEVIKMFAKEVKPGTLVLIK